MRAIMVAVLLCVGCQGAKAKASAQMSNLSANDAGPETASAPMPSVASTSAPRVLRIGARSGPPTTLAILLHGYGAEATSFHGIARWLAPEFPDVAFLTPDGFEPSELGRGRQWFSAMGLTDANRAGRVRASAMGVSSWIDRELDTRKLEHNRLFVIGFSQGASIAAWLAIHRSPPPTAVVMFSGQVAEDGPLPTPHTPGARVLIAHGTDDPRIPIAVVNPGAALLEASGAYVTTRVYENLGHSIDERELHDASEFLEASLR